MILKNATDSQIRNKKFKSHRLINESVAIFKQHFGEIENKAKLINCQSTIIINLLYLRQIFKAL